MTHSETAPAVSIVVPAYNVSQFIAETLDSALAQTFTDYEIIVVNDGSPDTARLEEVIGPYRDRLVYLKQENKGISGARNAGIRAARGEFIALLDGDDLWEPTFLERQVGEMRRRPDLDLLYCDTVLFGNTPLSGQTFMSMEPSERPIDLATLLAQKAIVVTSCVVARRQRLFEAGLFDERQRYVEDFDLWCRMAAAGMRLDFTPEPLGRRRHGGAQTSNNLACLTNIVFVYNKHRGLPGLNARHVAVIDSKVAQFQAELDLELGKKHLADRNRMEALRHLAAANRYFHRPKLTALIFALRLFPPLAYHLRRFSRQG
jgi:glycosyltransferase involved in cell wall biosynthesis